jgi:hypothetical protein
MAAAKRLSPEQIVAKLREAGRLQGQGATIPQVCKKLGCASRRSTGGGGCMVVRPPIFRSTWIVVILDGVAMSGADRWR